MQSLGERMKENYEFPSRHTLVRRVPVIVRVDGRAFHTLTRGCKKPFDENLMYAMASSAIDVAAEMQGCKAAYVQSDEASFLLTDYDSLQTQPWFGYVKSKVETIAASCMTYHFSRYLQLGMALFDARAFNIPREEVANYFLWRMQDWHRNSLSMYCRAFFSHAELEGKTQSKMHEMLHRIGKTWATDLNNAKKNGIWIFADGARVDIWPNYKEISAVLDLLINCDEVSDG